MIYFTLPNFHINSKVNENINRFFRNDENLNKLIAPIRFIAESGSYPYLHLNGSINNNSGKLLSWSEYNDICNIQSIKNGTSIRFNLKNYFINEYDFTDCLLNVILETHHNGSNYIETDNLGLIEYISNKYPNYMFIFSTYAKFLKTLDENFINQLIDTKKFTLINLPMAFNKDLNYLKNIKNRKYIELNINNLCADCDEQTYNKCLIAENEYQYNFSKKSVVKNCKNRYRYTDKKSINITMEEILNVYVPMGIKYFKLCDFVETTFNVIDFIHFIANYFIKEEYRLEFIMFMMQEAFND